MAASELAAYGSLKRKKQTRIIVIALLSFGMALLGLCLMLYVSKKKPKREGIILHNPGSIQDFTTGSENDDLELPLFRFATIAYATDNFSVKNVLGKGGFGQVYKGILTEGQENKEIAVKRLSTDSRQGLHEFKNEVLSISKLQHRNLVKILGCCIQEEERMLIYEYMPNKSLDYFIFDPNQSILLDWPKRFHIINGIARGLLYLHQDSRLRIIHRDLKASNILLDYEMNPKIADFGMARIFGGDETEAKTSRVVGTYGYMPPEYAIDGLFSVKSDVYSFGVLVLEIVSGKRNREFSHPDHSLNLLGHGFDIISFPPKLTFTSSKLYFFGREFNIDDPHIDEDVKKKLKNVERLECGISMNKGNASPKAFVANGKIYMVGSTIKMSINEICKMKDLYLKNFAYFEVYDPIDDKCDRPKTY
ncbi:hypothetical protein CMV_021284 [Castanea mollissima]|uniref:non-specific serine/threonine protein kinase n=1 Tax=Castanea mollissima TaxID=60419 RepID=A0A8J4QP78_9ROSI|nr:hypothetical protein CMV_021284 [Castanea mollissima]